MKLLALQYNNYFNRIIKQESDWNSYEDGHRGHRFSDMNFNPNDGVSTNVVVNWLDTYNFTPDYLVVADNDYNIVSRWFIIEGVRLKGGQYQLTLRRDLIVDNYDSIVESPMFVEKAYLNPTNYNDPAIFNKEGLSFNQIKKSETLIDGNVKGPWLVMYLKDKPDSASNTINFSSSEVEYDYSFTTLPPNSFVVIDKKDILVYERYTHSHTGSNKIGDIYTNCLNTDTAYRKFNSHIFDVVIPMTEYMNDEVLSQYGTASSGWVSDFNNAMGYAEDTDYRYLDGKTIYVDGVLYKCSVNRAGDYSDDKDVSSGAIYEDVKAFFRDNGLLTSTASTRFCELRHRGTTYSISFDSVDSSSAYHTTISPSASWKVNNQPYFMVCAPLTDKVIIRYNLEDVSRWGRGNMNIAYGLYKELSKTSEWLVDAQIVPYCPIEKFRSTNVGPISNLILPEGYPCLQVFKGTGDTEYSIRLPFVIEDSFTIEKPFTIDVDNYKLSNECDMYRLVSPNYNGAFEFSVAKNYGLDKFIIRCTYKPISPLISVAPNFKGLYGSDYKDNRGLICQGSFQLGRETDEFKEYEYRNKNYQNAFNNQIAVLDKQNYYQTAQEIVNASVGAVGAGGVGATLGGKGLISPVGAAVGVAGGAITGIADVAINKQLRDINRELTVKQHEYQLGNIQALSYTVSNISNIDILSKYYPFLEYYSCTDIEKQSLIDFLEYKGYNIGRIGTIGEFLQPERHYFQGYLLRLNNSTIETHETLELNNELSQGVYI